MKTFGDVTPDPGMSENFENTPGEPWIGRNVLESDFLNQTFVF